MVYRFVKTTVEDTETRSGRAFDLVIQVLIVLSLVAFCTETLPNLPDAVKKVLEVFELVSIVIFTSEYLLRLIVADRKLRFIISFFGLVDLCAILPFYVSAGIVDLRSVRIIRLVRAFRAFKILRYSRAVQLFANAFHDIRGELVLFFAVTLFLIFISSVGIYYFENTAQPEAYASVFHAMWWSVITLTTVGYGDLYPVTVGGKIFTFVILMVGLAIVAVPAGLFSSALTKAREALDKATTEAQSEEPGD